MKRFISLILLASIVLILTSCNSDYVPKEQSVSYAKDIQVVITELDKKQWFAGTAQREVKVTVYSEEYNLTGKDTVRYTGMFGRMPLWEAKEGDTVKARMIVCYMESTGEVTNRYIDKVYS
ncbi:MAG: hypothetical protein IKL68_05215 [Clostridia bacterium]|nr:hypothetical protein [Clostridia bacterium]